MELNYQYFQHFAKNLFWPQVVKYYVPISVLLAAVLTFGHFYKIGINFTESLPYSVFLIIKDSKHEIKANDYVSFEWQSNTFYPQGLHFVKQIKGVPGDEVRLVDRKFYIGDEGLGYSKPVAKNGMLLTAGLTGTIPKDHFYVYAPHPDSLDSRYAITGWVSLAHIEGRAIPLF